MNVNTAAEGGMSPMVIGGGILVLVIIIVVILWATGVFDFGEEKEKAGEDCEGPDPNTKYKIDASGECVIDSCIEGYVKEDDMCVLDTVKATGGTVTTEGDFTVHTFKTNGEFKVTKGGEMDVLIVGGGGGGGSDNAGGGGGGGVIHKPTKTVSTGSYTIGVGAGGRHSGTRNADLQKNGENSSAFGHIAIGGGRGANGQNGSKGTGDGGSGGGGQGERRQGNDGGGSGEEGQGFKGGDGRTKAAKRHGNFGGGGGGGASSIGKNGENTNGGDGGQGLLFSDERYYGSGGAGGGRNGRGGGGGGTFKGNGKERGGNRNVGGDGEDGSGGGGGGSSATGSRGGKGGSGVVIIRYRT